MTISLCIAAIVVLNALVLARVASRDRQGRRVRAQLLAEVASHPSRFKEVWTEGPNQAGDSQLYIESLAGVTRVLADGFEYDAARERLRHERVPVREPEYQRATATQRWSADPRSLAQASGQAYYWKEAAHAVLIKNGVAVLEPAYRRAMFPAATQRDSRPAESAPGERSAGWARVA